MRGLHWWTLIGGVAIGYLILPPVVAMIKGRMS